MGAEKDIFWSEIGSGFGELGSTPHPEFPGVPPPPPIASEITDRKCHNVDSNQTTLLLRMNYIVHFKT